MVLGHDTSTGERTSDIQISQDVTFDTLLLKPETLKGLKTAGFFRPSPVQLHGIPLGNSGFDLLLEAKSGTGKTAVFTIIALEKINISSGVQVIILAPTREIAAQICDVIKAIGVHYDGLGVEVVMGGLPFEDDIAKFNKKNNVHIVVGSPGRLRHLIQKEYIDTSYISLLVLDEADQLMGKTFQPDINYIFSTLPKYKQVILSSATYPKETNSFLRKYVRDAQHICPDSTNVLLGIEQKVTTVKSNKNIVKQTQLRYEELLKILTKRTFKQCLIFCNFQARVAELHKMLTRNKWPSEQLHGKQVQTDRLEALKTLQAFECRILISTDLAARGIDASNVDLVINFEPPYDWQTFLHRIGRAGRYGSYGIAITILSEGVETKKFWNLLESVKGTVSLYDLWSDKKIKHDSSIEHETKTNSESELEEQPEIKTDVKTMQHNFFYKDVWNETLGDSSQNGIDLESFEDLKSSYDLYSMVEKLSDVKDNSQSDDNRPELVRYKTMQIGDYAVQQCSSYLQSKKQSDSNKNPLNYKADAVKIPELKQEQNESNEKQSQPYNFTKKTEIIEDLAVKQCPSFLQSEIQSNSIKRPLNFEENGVKLPVIDQEHNESTGRPNKEKFMASKATKIESDSKEETLGYSSASNEGDIEASDQAKAMAQLGLPTSFGKKKPNYTRTKKFRDKIKYDKDTEMTDENQAGCNESEETEFGNKNETDTYEVSVSHDHNSDSHKVDKPKKNCITAKCNKDEKKYRTRNKKHSQSSNQDSENSIKQPEKYNAKYNNWYKELKFRIRQGEYLIYIENMSK